MSQLIEDRNITIHLDRTESAYVLEDAFRLAITGDLFGLELRTSTSLFGVVKRQTIVIVVIEVETGDELHKLILRSFVKPGRSFSFVS